MIKEKIHYKESSRYFSDYNSWNKEQKGKIHFKKDNFLRKERKGKEMRNIKEKSVGIKNRNRSAKIQII